MIHRSLPRTAYLFAMLLFLLAPAYAFATTYYVDATGGADGNNGTATNTAWQTINKVNNASLSSGDNVLFKRGETWSGSELDAQAGVTYGDYGSGALPLINAADSLLGLTWSSLGSNRWSATYSSDPTALFFDNATGTKAASVAGITGSHQWYWTANTVTVYSTSNPSSAFSALDAAVRYGMFINAANVTVQNLDFRKGIHGIVIEQAGSTLSGCYLYLNAANGIYYYGSTVNSGTATNCSGDYNGTGVAWGNGAGTTTFSGGTFTHGYFSPVSAGDGLQISQDAGTGITIDGVTSSYNDKVGINIKVGTQTIRNATLTYNGEGGIVAQNDLIELTLENSYLANNNQYDNGVPNMNIEDHAIVRSKHNYYGPVYAGSNATGNVILTGATSKFYSQYDYFQGGSISSGLFVGHVRTNVSTGAATVDIQNDTIYDPNADSGYLFRFGGAPNLNATIYNTIFYSSGRHMIELVDGSTHDFNNNQYYSTDINSYIQIIEDASFGWLRQYLQSEIASLRSTESTDAASQVGDPLFVSAPSNIRLQSTSPAINKGKTTSIHTAQTTDYFGNYLASTPDIGAAEYQSGFSSRILRLVGGLRLRGGIRLR